MTFNNLAEGLWIDPVTQAAIPAVTNRLVPRNAQDAKSIVEKTGKHHSTHSGTVLCNTD